LKFVNGNSAPAPTLNVNSTGAAVMQKHGMVLEPTDIPSGHVAHLVFDGTNWQLLNPSLDLALLANSLTALTQAVLGS